MVPAIRKRYTARGAATAAFGLLMWMQLGSGALARELAYNSPDTRRIIVFVLPLVLLATALLLRNTAVALLLFPTSFGAVLMLAAPAVADQIAEPTAMVFSAMTMVSYALVASLWLQVQAEDPLLEVTREPFRAPRDRWRPYRGTFLPRAVLLVAAFVVTAAAIPLLPPLVENVTGSFGRADDVRSAQTGLVLCNLILFFVWCVLAYALFLTPALEVESRVRRLETQMQASLVASQTVRRKVTLVLAAFSAVALLLALFMSRAA